MGKILITLLSVGLIFLGGLSIYIQGVGPGFVPLCAGILMLGILIGITLEQEQNK